MNWLSRLRSLKALVLLLNLLVLALPIVGIVALHIVTNLLHRQTETKLAAEAAYVQALYIEELARIETEEIVTDFPPVRYIPNPPPLLDDYWRPFFPTLDLSRQEVLPSAPPSLRPREAAHAVAVEAGARLMPLLRAVKRYNLSGVRVLDANGVVVATDSDDLGQDLSNREEVAAALGGHYTSVLRDRGVKPPAGSISRRSRVRVYVAIPIMLDRHHLAGVVYLHRTSLSFFRDMWEPRYIAALVFIVVIAIAISLGLSSLMVRPLKDLIGQAQRVAAGGREVEVRSLRFAPREALELGEALSQMVDRLNQRMEYIEQFSRNVSHELKTPLAGMQGAIELLKENWPEMTDAEREKFLHIIESESKRMERLVRRLLELARLEMAPPPEESTELSAALDALVRRWQENGKPVNLAGGAGPAPARVSPDLAEIIFGNLIDNAVVHGGGAPVTVRLKPGLAVEVEDSGPGISEANLPRVFDRFFTTSRASGGTGLGLSMVRAAADACGARVEVESAPGRTVFRVTFQPANGPAGESR